MMNEKNNIVAQGRGNYRRYADDSFEFTPQGKGEALKRPEMPIRYLTTNTSNNVFFRREFSHITGDTLV